MQNASKKLTAGSDNERSLPHNLDAEMGLLGSMLLDPITAGTEAFEQVDEQVFYQPAHATVFGVLRELWQGNKPCDVIAVTDLLRQRGKLDAVGGPAYVSSLIGYTPTAANAKYYLEVVREKYVLRSIIKVCTDAAAHAYDDDGEVNLLLDATEARILAVRERLEVAKADTHMRDEVMVAIEHIERLYEKRGQPEGLSTGFSRFDNLTGGLQATDMIVVAARPSMGKSAWAMNVAEHVAVKEGKAVGVFSLEMSSQQLVQRLLCSRARVNMQKVRDGFLSERDFPNLTSAASKLAETRIYIDDRGGLSILQLRAKARRWVRQYDIKLVIIDYLQLLRSNSRRGQDSRQVEVAEVSAGIKALAKELKLPILVLAQLNRNPEARAGGRPRLSDLRESGSIEMDADVIGLLHRPEYYASDEEEKAQLRGLAELEIAKNRTGPVGEVPLTFLKEYTLFTDRAKSTE